MAIFDTLNEITSLVVHSAHDLYRYEPYNRNNSFFIQGPYRYFAYKGSPGQRRRYELCVYASNEFEAYICALDLGYESIEIL